MPITTTGMFTTSGMRPYLRHPPVTSPEEIRRRRAVGRAFIEACGADHVTNGRRWAALSATEQLYVRMTFKLPPGCDKHKGIEETQ